MRGEKKKPAEDPNKEGNTRYLPLCRATLPASFSTPIFPWLSLFAWSLLLRHLMDVHHACEYGAGDKTVLLYERESRRLFSLSRACWS